MRKLLIIDGHNLLFRSYFGIPQAACLPSGLIVNAVYGFFASFKRVYKFSKPDLVISVFDSETGINKKVEENASYKANRVFEDVGMFKQLPFIKEILKSLNIEYLEHPSYEADDVIGSLTEKFSKKGMVDIFSNDKDFIQLIAKNVFLVREQKGKIIKWGKKDILENYGFDPSFYLDYLSIKGDVSDNISGIFGIGEKTSMKLVSKYGNIENIWENLKEESPRIEKLMAKNFNKVFLNKKLLKINRELDIKIKFTQKPKQFLEENLEKRTTILLNECGYK